MLRDLTLPVTLSRVLEPLRSCFTAPSFEVFTALVAGLVAQPVSRTVCGMLTGAGLAGGVAPLSGASVLLRGAVVPTAGGAGAGRTRTSGTRVKIVVEVGRAILIL